MSLARYLAAGRSVRVIEDGPNRFKLVQSLPRFGNEKTPLLWSNPEVEPAEVPAPETEKTTADAEEAPRDGFSAAAMKTVKPTSSPQQRVKTASLAAAIGWHRLRNLFRRSPRVPVRSIEPQQPELSLESVHVVRNDLTDSDLEVVLRKPAAVSPVPVFSASAMGHPPPWWSRIAERILKLV